MFYLQGIFSTVCVLNYYISAALLQGRSWHPPPALHPSPARHSPPPQQLPPCQPSPPGGRGRRWRPAVRAAPPHPGAGGTDAAPPGPAPVVVASPEAAAAGAAVGEGRADPVIAERSGAGQRPVEAAVSRDGGAADSSCAASGPRPGGGTSLSSAGGCGVCRVPGESWPLTVMRWSSVGDVCGRWPESGMNWPTLKWHQSRTRVTAGPEHGPPSVGGAEADGGAGGCWWPAVPPGPGLRRPPRRLRVGWLRLPLGLVKYRCFVCIHKLIICKKRHLPPARHRLFFYVVVAVRFVLAAVLSSLSCVFHTIHSVSLLLCCDDTCWSVHSAPPPPQPVQSHPRRWESADGVLTVLADAGALCSSTSSSTNSSRCVQHSLIPTSLRATNLSSFDWIRGRRYRSTNRIWGQIESVGRPLLFFIHGGDASPHPRFWRPCVTVQEMNISDGYVGYFASYVGYLYKSCCGVTRHTRAICVMRCVYVGKYVYNITSVVILCGLHVALFSFQNKSGWLLIGNAVEFYENR